jgi:hypothetical protein
MENINRDRRRFFGEVAATAAAAQLGMLATAHSQSNKTAIPAIKPGTNTSFAPLKQIDAGVLNVGYAEAGPADGPPVILLHGWPYDIYSFVDVAPLLASAGPPRACALPARLRQHAPPVERHDPQRPTLGDRRRSQGLS